jgi:hypothetical protein
MTSELEHFHHDIPDGDASPPFKNASNIYLAPEHWRFPHGADRAAQ